MTEEKKPKPTRSSSDYSAKNISVLEGLDPVRKRPGMYIGGVGADGLHHLIREVVDNAIDEALAGEAKTISLILGDDDLVEVEDDGRGIPVDLHPQTKKSALETVMTTLHAGGKFGGGGYKVSGGLHGVGVSAVNALSEWTRAEVYRDGKIYAQDYRRGKPEEVVKVVGKTEKRGTKIAFRPDQKIFKTIEWESRRILQYLRQQAYLTQGVRIFYRDLRSNRPTESPADYGFYFESGISSYVSHLNRARVKLNSPPFMVSQEIESEGEKYLVEVSIQYTEDFVERVFAFANNIHTVEGGTHLTGFRTALTRVLNDYAKKNKLIKESDSLSGDDVREGLTAVISLKLSNPQFEGQTKSKLGNPEAQSVVNSVLAKHLGYYLDENPSIAKRIMEKAALSLKARLAAKAARDTVLRKGALDGMTLPGKLADCSDRRPSRCELYIVEGDSAGGSSKQARDRSFQAVLSLRGKILNVERARLDRMLTSDEIKALIVALGIGIGDQINYDKLRYHRIIIMADADVDGAHIRTLLLTFFYRNFPELISRGHLYIAQPPLFLIEKGRRKIYAYNEAEKERILAGLAKERSGEKIEPAAQGSEKSPEDQGAAETETTVPFELGIKGVSVQRYKGLGEMNPSQLWETTLNPENRVLLKVSVDDAEQTDELFSMLMGDEVPPRKRFIQTHARTVKNLDV